MQKNDMAMKRRILIDGDEVPGLVESSPVKDEEGVIDVPGFNRTVPVKNGIKKFDPLDLTYKIQKDTITQKFFYDWFFLNEFHDLTVIQTDGVGQEINRWLLRDCECAKYDEKAYSAAGVEFFSIDITITCTAPPVRLEE